MTRAQPPRTLLAGLVALLGAVSLPALALQVPRPCGPDAHVQCGTYDPGEVYLVASVPGQATLIQFEPGETVDEPGSAVGLGDASAWKVGAGGNWLLLKPRAQEPGTNMLVVTNRRRYAFRLAPATAARPATWSLSFDYPDTRARATNEAQRKAQRARDAMAGQPVQAGTRNDAFRMRGDTVLAPTAMWDDGRFTYLRYASTRDRPVVFRIQPDGSEAMTNGHTEGDTLVLHETAREFVLRLGQAVLGIRNDGYTEGQYNASATTTPGVVRLNQGE
ncbi:TrbG/VirB9 family P-type conjugative transfer protein [Cupriavidus necator]